MAQTFEAVNAAIAESQAEFDEAYARLIKAQWAYDVAQADYEASARRFMKAKAMKVEEE